MFVFVFVLFWFHLGSLVNVNLCPNINVNVNVNVNVHLNLDVWTNKRSSLFDNKDTSNSNTDRFYSGLGSHLLKQVDDIYIQAVTMKGLDKKLRVAAKEAMEYGCTWSISKFFAGRPCNIVSGFRVVLDPSGINSPQIGQDSERVKHLQKSNPLPL